MRRLAWPKNFVYATNKIEYIGDGNGGHVWSNTLNSVLDSLLAYLVEVYLTLAATIIASNRQFGI
jgi:hypothetical protein